MKIPSAERRLRNYPFEFSGGMRQRVVAAMAMARSPRLLIADEPTTALDVTIQDQFLRLLKEMQAESGMALILVTHNLGIVAEVCDSVAIMYAGRIVESGSVARVYNEPAHPYTRGLMDALPKTGRYARSGSTRSTGEPPDLCDLPAGCHFHPRCVSAMDICRTGVPTGRRGAWRRLCGLLAARREGRRGNDGNLLELGDLTKCYRIPTADSSSASTSRSTRSTASRWPSKRGPVSAWWARPAAARRRSRS